MEGMIVPMKPKTIIGLLLGGSVVIPIVAILTTRLPHTPSIATMAMGATLTATWVVILAVLLLTSSQRGSVGRGVLATTFIGALLLLIGFGSVALAAWEEVVAGQELPTINLFIFLIPLGFVLLFVAYIVLFVRKKLESR